MLLNCGAGENSWESLGLQGDPTNQSWRKLILNIHWKDWYWSWNSNTLATWCEELTLRKDPGAGKDCRQEEKGTIEDEMARWHHWVDRHEFEQTLGVDDGQGSQACCSPWGHKELDTTEWQNWTEVKICIKSDKNIETHLYLNIQRYIVDKIRKILCSSLISKWK